MANWWENDPVISEPTGTGDKFWLNDPVVQAHPIAPKIAPERTVLGTLGDVGVTALKGAIGLPQGFMGLASLATGGQAGKDFEDSGVRFADAQKMLDAAYSPAQQAANQRVQDAEGFVGTLGAALENPSVIAKTVGESIPQMLGGAAIARGGLALTSKLAPWAAGAIGEGAMGAGAAAEQLRQESANGLLNGKQTGAALASGVGTALIGAGAGKFANSALGKRLGVADVDTMLASGATVKSPAGFLKQVVGSGISEGALEEMPQSAQEQMWQNYAQDKPLMEGVGENSALGLLSGAAMGGAGGGYNAAMAPKAAEQAPPPVVPVTAPIPGGSMDAAELLGRPQDTELPASTVKPVEPVSEQPAPAPVAESQALPPEGSDGGVAPTQDGARTESVAPEITAAEKALSEPVALTALDRVNEIAQESTKLDSRLTELNDPANGYSPMFDQERTELTAQRAQLTQEKQALTKDWPKIEPGTPTSFTTEAGARVNAQYAIIDASALVTSHDTNLRKNPIYPQELQPRERDRAASEMQVSSIVQKLDPARLGLSADAANGAPIVGADGLVESGNARTIALKRVYQANGQKAVDYKQFLSDNAAQFGITPESVQSMANPVLVRVRTTPVNRAEFARQANASTVAQMSPSEQAKSDANRIDTMEDLTPDESGDFQTSRDFIRRFMSRLPVTEQSGMIDSTGALSSTGYARVRNAVLAKAYGDSPVLARLTESLNDDLRNISKALMTAAPKVAQLRDAVAAGQRFDADITPDLMAAVEEMAKLKLNGTSIHDALAQAGMFGDQYSDETRLLLQFMADNIRRPKRMADFITSYMEALDAAGDPNQGSLLGDTVAPTKSELLNATKRNHDNDDAAKNTKRGNPAENARPGQEARSQPENAPGDSGGTQGDGGAGRTEPTSTKPEISEIAQAREQAAQDFKAALADLAQIASKHTRVMMYPEDTPDLMPTLVELFDAGIRLVGTDMKRLIANVKAALKTHGKFKFNLIKPETLQKAALKALEGGAQGLFSEPEILSSPTRLEVLAQQDLLAKAPALDQRDQVQREASGFSLQRQSQDNRKDNTGDMFGGPSAADAQAANARAQSAKGRKPAGEDMFSAQEAPGAGAKPEAPAPLPEKKADSVVIDGQEYDLDAPDFGGKPWPKTLKEGDALLTQTSTKPLDSMVTFNDMEMTRAQMHKQIVDWHFERARPAPAGRKPVAYVMGGGGASGKGTVKKALRQQGVIHDDGAVNLDPDEIKLEIPEYQTIVKAGDSRAAAIVHQESSDLSNVVKKRAMDGRYDMVLDVTLGEREKGIKTLQELKDAGYDVRLLGVTTDPATSVIRAIGRAERSGRYVPIATLLKAHKVFNESFETYAGIVDSAALYENTGGRIELASGGQGVDFKTKDGYDVTGKRSKLNEHASTIREIGAGQVQGPQATQQAGTDRPAKGHGSSGRPVDGIATSRKAGAGAAGFSGESDGRYGLGGETSPAPSQGKGGVNANAQPGAGSTQKQSPGAAQGAGRQGRTDALREGHGRADQLGSGVNDNGRPSDSSLGQAASDGARRQAESGRKPQSGNRSVTNVGVPAGRDIPAKSGLNYQFGDNDLTYEGSWAKKAAQNVDAVEMLRKLETEGRKATRDEQAVLAKFVGWGSSEMANNLFGNKLDKTSKLQKSIANALAEMDKLKRDYLNKGGQYRGQYADLGYYEAVSALRDAGKVGVSEYPARVTRDDLNAAQPDAGTLRWLALKDRMKAAMSPAEWAEAARSTQYAHYTSKPIVKSMWKAMERMGFKGGTLLEPGAGIGIFPGLMPPAMATNSIYTGVEFDTITGSILKQLFPDERILVESFVDTKLPKNFYDAAAGNPPFSSTKILSDPEYAKQAFSLHDYFFAKTIDRVKPGGLVMFVTSRFTMDKLDDKARKYLADRADLVGAIRLPQTAFKQNAGTEVVTDVLFLRKKVPGETFGHAKAWMGVAAAKAPDGADLMVSANKVGDPDRVAMVNEYFAAHPEMVLGQHSNVGSMYKAKDYTVTPLEGDIEAHFAKAVENLPADIYRAERGSSAEAAKVREIDFNPKAKKEGNYYLSEAGQLMQRESGVGQRVELKKPADAEIIKAFVPLRDALKQAHYDQLNAGDWATSLLNLQTAYAAFTKQHGFINQFVAKTVKVKIDELDDDGEPTGNKIDDQEVRRSFPLLDKLKDDPDHTLVQALEKLNEDTGEITQSEFLKQRVLGLTVTPTATTPTDALLTTLNDIGHVDMAVIAERIGMSQQDTIDALGTAVYNDPESGWTTADEYLSGNVKRKLELAKAAAKSDRNYERNVTALEAAQPEPLSPSQIDPRLGMNWIPGDVYAQFMREKVGLNMSMAWDPRTKTWDFGWDSPDTHQITTNYGKVEKTFKTLAGAEKALAKMNEGYEVPRYKLQAIETAENKSAMEDWGTPDFPAQRLMEHAMTGAPIRVETKDSDGRPYFDEAATEAAKDKHEKLHKEFAAWVFSDANRADRLVQLYNDKFNTTTARSFDGTHLTLPGASLHWQAQVHPHVKRGVWRIVQTGNTYLAHAVGSGKTAQMVMSAMEQKRLGLVKKPMIVVPNHMLKQFASEWLDIYPAARLMVADEHSFHTDNRRRFVSRVALSDLDGVVITHSAFKLLDLDPEFKAKMIEEQLTFFRAALGEAGGKTGEKGKSRDPKIKRIESQIENMEQKLQSAMSSDGKDKNVRFDELGVDFLYVDEAHEFRKLDFTTVREVKGLSPQGSGRAFDLYMKSRYLESKTPGRSMVMASGTPVTNTIAELYTVQKMLGGQALVDRGIEDFDSWASMFGREKTNLEPNAAGKYEPVTRFQDFANIPELTQMFREFADVLTSDYLAQKLGDKRPQVENGSREIVITPETTEYEVFRDVLADRVRHSKAWKPSPGEPYNPDPIIKIIGDGRLAAIDMRFMDPTGPNNPDSKLNRMIDDVIATLKETADVQYRGKNLKDAAGKEIEESGDIEPVKGSTMMVFSDLGFGAGVAKSRGFNARAWFEKRLRDAGIPPAKVAFMSDFKKSTDKLKLFSDVNAGRVRLLIGSSKSMGTGVNAQQRLKALFHLDSPWYPADLEQREGRIVRQGNKNKVVRLKAYAAKGSYDSQMWGQLANKQMFIDKALSGDPNVRKIEDAGAADMMAIVSGMAAKSPRVLQLAGLDTEIGKMQRLYQAHEDQRASFRTRYNAAQTTIEWNTKRLPDVTKQAEKAKDLSGDKFTAKVGNTNYSERAKWAEALIAKYADLTARGVTQVQQVGEISGFVIAYGGETIANQYRTKLMLDTPMPVELVADAGTSPMGVSMRAQNAVADVARLPAKMRERIAEATSQADALATRMNAAFPMAEMLAEKVRERDALRESMAAESKEIAPEALAKIRAGMTADPEEETVLSRASGKSGVLSSDGKFKAWPKFWNRAEYNDVVSLLPEANRNDPRRQQPIPTKDWDVLSASVLPDLKALNQKVGPITRVGYSGLDVFTLDNLGNINLDARDQGSLNYINDAIEIADKHGLGVVVTGVPTGMMQRLIDNGFVGELDMGTILSRVSGSSQPPIPNSTIYGRALGTIMSRKPRGFPLIMFSRGAGTGMDHTELDKLVTAIKEKMPNMPNVNVLADPGEAPKALQDYIKAQGAWNDVEGAMHKGELYMFASGLSDATRAEHVLAEHEAAHFGLRAILGDDIKTVMQALYNNNPVVRQAAKEKQRNGKLSDTAAAEEVIVDIPSKDLIKLKGWRKLVLQARDWLDAHGFTRLADRLNGWLAGALSEQAKADLFVADLVRTARSFVAGKTQGNVQLAHGATRLAQTLANDLAVQEKWLNTEARARGYKDIDDLVDSNYPLFEKLSKLWRDRNPAENGVLLSRRFGVESAALKRWFGKSKVVDKGGKPLVVYHGTINSFNAFDPEADPFTYESDRGKQFFLDSANGASDYALGTGEAYGGAPNVMPVYLKMENPRIVTTELSPSEWWDTQGGDVWGLDVERLGHDGLIINGDGETMYVISNPTQIKSAIGNNGNYDPTNPDIRMSRAPLPTSVEDRVKAILADKAQTPAPLDWIAKHLTRATFIERGTKALYARAGFLLDKSTPEAIKSGFMSDYGVPEAVIDQRAMMQGRQRVQLRKAGSLIEKLSTLTRAESRVAYEWMNETDPHAIYAMMHNLPEESVKVLQEVQAMIDKLSQEAVDLGQLSPEAFKANRFAYLHRSYVKHTAELTKGEVATRQRAITILGDQYKGRGMTDKAAMKQIQNSAPEWWKRKTVAGKADTSLKGESFTRYERRAASGEKTATILGMDQKQEGKLLEVHYFPVGEKVPAKYADWTPKGVWTVRDTKGGDAIMWRDFTKVERERMGEIDEARFAIAKTLHGMIHDVEVGRYLKWLATNHAKKDGETIPGTVVEASTLMRHVFKPGEWVQVPDVEIHGTNVKKYGLLAGRYLPGPIWNDVRQFVHGDFRPIGDTYAKVLSMWKASKTALSPGVHLNNVMANFVMADWHDVTAGHVSKALRTILAASQRDGKGLLGNVGNAASRLGAKDVEAARAIMNRYQDSGGSIGTWATQEIAQGQMVPLLDELQKEMATAGLASGQAQVGVMSSLQYLMRLRFGEAWEAAKGSKPGVAVRQEAGTMLDMYEAEDQVFRLAKWLAEKENGATDMAAGKAARKSFLDYHINAPWIAAMRSTAWPFISFTYRAVPMMLDIAANKPHKFIKLMAVAGALNAFGVMLGGGGDDDERKLLPEEKAGSIWGMVPKLIRMPWNDANDSPVYLDIRRFIPVGDMFDIGAGHAAIPVVPYIVPGGPIALFFEMFLNKSMFTGQNITLETDTTKQQAVKVIDYLYKTFAPNLIGLPGTYATTGVVNAATGKTDAFGRQQSVAQAMATGVGVKLGSYPADVMRLGMQRKTMAQVMEIDHNISKLKRQYQQSGISYEEFSDSVKTEQEKKVKLMQDLQEKLN